MREGIIYLITDTVNGKKYIGQTVKGLSKRWKTHLQAVRRGSKNAIHKAIRKYGAESFTIEVIAETLEPFLDDLEVFFIRLHNTFSKWGYNLTEGGGGVRGTRSEEFRERCRLNMTGKSPSAETKAKLSLAHKGSKRSPEVRQKMKLLQVARAAKLTPEDRLQLSERTRGNTNKLGKPHSEETRRKIGLANKGKLTGRKRSPEATEKARLANTGRKRSAETKQKIGLSKQKLSPESRERLRLAALRREAKKREQPLTLAA
jgi:group I intron endonuclease